MDDLREVKYFYKACVFNTEMSDVDKKRYFHYSRYGYNLGNCNKSVMDSEGNFNKSIKHIRK